MAEIASSTVFTNDIVSYNTPDLLQQAFQEVVEQDNHEHEFVTFLAGDNDESQAIHLTHAQASALRLTFQVDSTIEHNGEEIVYQDPNDMLIEIQHDSTKDKSIELPQAMEQMDLVSNNQWAIDDVEETEVKTLNMANTNTQVAEGITNELTNHLQARNITSILMQHPQVVSKSNSNGTIPNYNAIAEITPNFVSCGVPNIQNQTLPNRLPVIFPSSQFIIKPAQTILKAGKSIRLIQSTNAIGGSNNNTVPSINSTCNSTTQNSVLLPKATLINSMAPQILKTTPITSQLIHSNAISAQLLDSSQILTCDKITTANLNNCNGNNFVTNTVTRTTQNVGNNSIRMSPLIATTASNIIIQQSTISSVPKSTCESTATVKSNISNGTTTSIAGPLFKSLQSPTGMLKTTSVTVGKTLNTSIPTKVSVTPTSAMILKNGSRLKTQQFKRITTSAPTALHHRIPTQSISSSISILKPQTKVAFANSTRPNSMINSHNITNVNHNNMSNAKLIPKVARNYQTLNNHIKPSSTIIENKLRTNESISAILPSSRVVKKPKIMGTSQNPPASTLNDAGKPLGSSENPIQIVQQGHTFHSMQKLTQTQLKQIAHVLQQRSQESTDPNERVVYRVVFPEELDLRIRNPINLLKGRAGKRGRPKKKPSTATKSSTHEEDGGVEDVKDERKKPVARTRSGRLSRPPRHIVRDYKHLHHLDLLQPDLDDSDGGYSDYNVSTDKLETDDVAKDLLTGYEGPKRKISDHFRCPTCNKIYLGRTRMAKHFEIHPDHGSTDQLPPRTAEQDLKSNAFPPDPFKRKGKKRGPWAYITPEAKSERRQIKLKDALSACDNGEIIKIAAKPLLNAQSLFDLMVLKSNNCLKTFLNELKTLMNKTREQVNVMLTPMDDENKYGNTIKVDDKLLCDALGLAPGLYYVKDDTFNKSTDFYNTSMTTPSSLLSSSSSSSSSLSALDEPPMKVLKITNDEGKENIDERLSNGLAEISDLNMRPNFLDERNLDSINANCPEVLTALTLMPRSSGSGTSEPCKSNNISKLLISNTEIQSQISDNPGFQKIDINNSNKSSSFKKVTEMNHNLDISNCASSVFPKLDGSYEQSKLESLSQAFIKLEPMQQVFIKLENGNVGTYLKEESQLFRKSDSGFDNMNETTQTFAKGFQKLISKIVPMSTVADGDCIKSDAFHTTTKNDCKSSDSGRINDDSVPIMATTCDASIFGSTDNLDISKMTNYDLDILSNGGVMDKHLIMDEKLVEQLHLVDQSNLVDELVSERLKNIMPDNILDSNLMANSSNLDTELDFEALSEEFNRNTRS